MAKPKGQDFLGFLGSDYDSAAGFYLIAAESDILRAHGKLFTKSFITNHQDSSKYLLHILAFDEHNLLSWNRSSNQSESPPNSPVVVYDYFNKGFESLEAFYEEFHKNYNPAFRNIVVIDKLNILNCYCSHLFPNLKLFYKALRKYVYKIFGIINSSISTAKELNEAYGCVDIIALVIDRKTMQSPYCCYLLKNRPDTKASVNKILFDVQNDAINQIDEERVERNSHKTTSTDDNLAALTTFRLTLNETEKESKSKLHLPYFDAQRKEGSENSALDENDEDDDFDDEDDEEI